MTTWKIKALKVFLKVSAIIQATYWGLSHLFFPEWYLRFNGYSETELQSEFLRGAMTEIGILTLGTALSSYIASQDPVKNKNIIKVLCWTGTGSLTVCLYYMFFPTISFKEVGNVIAISIQLSFLLYLYPRSPTLDQLNFLQATS